MNRKKAVFYLTTFTLCCITLTLSSGQRVYQFLTEQPAIRQLFVPMSPPEVIIEEPVIPPLEVNAAPVVELTQPGDLAAGLRHAVELEASQR